MSPVLPTRPRLLRDKLKHEQVHAQLLGEITAGNLRPGDALSAELQLAETMGVSRSTIRQTLAELEREGLVRRIQGKGTFVTDQAHARLADLGGSIGNPARSGEQASGILLSQSSPAGNRPKLAAFALVLPEVRTGFYPSLIKGFGDSAAQLNHQMLVCCTDNDVEKQGNTILRLIDNRVAGIVLLPTTYGAPPVHQVRTLQSLGIPVVLLHRGVEGVSVPLIAMDYEQIARKVGRALTEAGHRRIAFFGTHRSLAGDTYVAGLRQALNEVGTELPEHFIHYGTIKTASDFDNAPAEHEARIEETLRQMLELPSELRPTAIFTPWDPYAELLYLMLGKLGCRVPGDMSLMGLGGVWRGSTIARRLTVVTADEEWAGQTAAKWLEEMGNGSRPLVDSVQAKIPLAIYPGETVGAPAH